MQPITPEEFWEMTVRERNEWNWEVARWWDEIRARFETPREKTNDQRAA